jgi:hypothetical protein
MNFKAIYDLIMFAGIGGPLMVAGGLFGYYVGLDANHSARCLLNCADPWQPAVLFALPGVVLALVQGAVKRLKKDE